MFKILIPILAFIVATTANADVTSQALNKVSEKISSTIGNLIPGEGLTEASVEIRENEKPDFNILAVRDIDLKEGSNFFSQFSLHNSEILNDERITGNIGFGYRTLNDSKTLMYGVNAFHDRDFTNGHERGSFGIELRGEVLDFNLNKYFKMSNQKLIDGTKEQVLGGTEYNLTSQVPYTPWAKFNFQGYNHDNELMNDQKGKIFSLEMAVNPSFQINLSEDQSSNAGVEDVRTAELTFIYPPRDNKPTMQDGLSSGEMFTSGNVEGKLKEKVRRNNNLVVEIQGAVIFTKK
tara:strand:- start:137 stop:1012 length:876 start_codon:yes stop_codon:yes gene_type:complete